MSPVPLLALLGAATLLHYVQALNCQWGSADTVRDVAELPFNWTADTKACEIGEGCQDTLMLIENGPKVSLVIIKGCTLAQDQEAQVTRHRAGPGLSVISYTRVCRHGDFCNDLSTTKVLGTLPTAKVPGTLRCPVCLSTDDCPKNAPEQICPAGYTHCYNGVLRLRGVEVLSNLRVQGCMPRPGCNLLNGTQKIGPIEMSENCNLGSGVHTLDCKSGALEALRDVSQLPLSWTTDWTSCDIGEGCQETVMLIQNGQQVDLLLSKGCTTAKDQQARVTRHRAGPGLSIISFTHVCRQKDFCNDLSTTESFWSPPPATVPGTLRCPVCLSTDDCPTNAPKQTCPAGHTHCYDGVLRLRGGRIVTNLRVQGCLTQPGCNLLNSTQNIGPIEVSENCNLGSGTQALECRRGQLEVVRQISEGHITWTTGWEICERGEGCQETVMLIENGPQVNFVLTKGCTTEKDQAARVTRHRAGPGLSVTSFTHVCRHKDLCNDLSTTRTFWTPHFATVPGTLRCPLCLSTNVCPANAPEQICPAGHTHCYSGVLSLLGGEITSNLRVQGCMPQPGCNLLNGTQKIGPIEVSENCNPGAAAQALQCQSGTLESVRNVSELPLQWTAGKATCEVGQGCQDTLLFVENGHRVHLVLIKGCTTAEDQEVRVTEHRAGPGLSIVSYTRVCRHGDFCNDLSTTAPLWAPPPVTVPGTLRCPLCLSTNDCPDNAPKQTCPAGHTHCYDGVLRLRGEISTNLRVQGCMPQPGCNLLNGTQTIGPMDVSENCNLDSETVTCYRGIMVRFGSSLSQEPQEWTAPGQQMCNAGDVCQETMLLIDVGHTSLLVGSKGCSGAGAKDSQPVSIYSRPPGMLVASYSRFCSSDLCNRASSSSVLLDTLPRPASPPPGQLRCPVCLQFTGSCDSNSSFVTCPSGTTHCYDGNIPLKGGGVTTTLSIQGCMASASRSLLNDAQNIGIFSVRENYKGMKKDKPEPHFPSGVAPTSYLACVLGLGLSLTLWLGGLCPPC